MDNMIIPGTNKEVRDGTIVILAGYGEVKYILHYGFYHYNSELCQGWYGESISEQIIIPIVEDMLVGCEVFYYPDADCCRFPNGDMPYTSQDDFQVQRSFITVSTEAERDALAPHMSITELPDGKVVCVLKPDGQTVDPKYYMYRHNPVDPECFWAELRIYVIPADGVPKSDLSEDVQDSLDKADTALQELPAYVVEWLIKNEGGQYDPASMIRNIGVLNELANKSAKEYNSYISYRGVLYPAAFWTSSSYKGVYVTLYDVQVEQVVRLSISSEGTPATYVQDRVLSINTNEFDRDDSWVPATQESTAEYIDEVTDPKGAAQAVQDNLDVVAGTVSSLSADVTQLDSEVSEIASVIPNQASAQNQLADKAFVNSSVATNTAHFIDTFDSVEALEEYSGPVTNNDYAFVVKYDPQQPTQIIAYDRYKWDSRDEEWKFEYELNNSSFTAEQWATINSGMTADLVINTRNHIANTTIHVTSEDKAAWNGKYTKPPAGIPSSDMTAEVQASLQRADTALQEVPIASDDTLGVIKIGDNLSIDENGVVSAEAGVETFILYWYDEPTEEQKQQNIDTVLEIKDTITSGKYCNVQLKFGDNIRSRLANLINFNIDPVIPPEYMIYNLGFVVNANSYGSTVSTDDKVYNICVSQYPGSLGTMYQQSRYDQNPIATDSTRGLVRIGSGINVDQNGVISNAYELPPATANTLGGVKIGDGINIDETGTISVDGSSVYMIPSNAMSATISDMLSNMAADYESGKPVSAYITLPSSPCKQIPTMITWFYRINSDYSKTVIAIYIDGIDFKHTNSYSQYSYDEIPYYYYIHCSLSGTTWSVSIHQGNYAQSTIYGNEVSDNIPSQYAIVNKRAVINYVKSKEYTLPPASTSTLGGVKIGNKLSVDQSGTVSVPDDTFVEVADYTEDMDAVDSAIQSAESAASAASIAASSAESAASAAASTAGGALQAVQSHAADTTIHVTSTEKTTWNNKQNALVAGSGISIVGDVISASGGSDTGWQPIGLVTSGQIGALQGAWAYEAPVDSAFAYRVINGNHVYLAGGFRVISAPSVDTIISATLPDAIRPRRLVPDGSGGLNWSIGNVRFTCATATANVTVELAIEQGSNVIRWKGMSGDTKTDMVSVMFDYYVS